MAERMKGAGWLGGILAVLTLLISTQGLVFLEWIAEMVRTIWSLPLFAPVAMSIFVGAALCAWLPHIAPDTWSRRRTLLWTRLLACGAAFFMMVHRYPSAVGFQYGLFAASGAYMLWTMAQNFLYENFPALRPMSLESDPCAAAVAAAKQVGYDEGYKAGVDDGKKIIATVEPQE